jgi:hypothetical protein
VKIYYKTLSQIIDSGTITPSQLVPLTLPMGEAAKNGPSPEGLPNGISWQAFQMAIWQAIKKQ